MKACFKSMSREAFSKASLSKAYAILCYPDDEGVRLNKGRPGAKDGPQAILKYLKKGVAHLDEDVTVVEIKPTIDLRQSLKKRHEQAEAIVFELFDKAKAVITLGGGHDYGYPDAAAFYRYFKKGVINVDAHTDMRPVLRVQFNSGTPFFRFKERFPSAKLQQWGVQMLSNAPGLLDTAKQTNTPLHSWRAPFPKLRSTWGLSVCLDAFEGLRGVSAPAFPGLLLRDGLEFVEHYSGRSPWLGVYECAPRLDHGTEDSARFAAKLISTYIHGKEGVYESDLLP